MGARGAAARGGSRRLSGSTISFAFVAGTVASANPCGFALLPAYLARRLGAADGESRPGDSLARALLVAAATTLGFLLVFGTLGEAIALGAQLLTRFVPWAGFAIGILLTAAGAVVLGGRHLGLRLPRQPGRGGMAAAAGLGGDLLFGIGYGTASLSCTLPVFLAATGTATTGGLLTSALGFLAYGAGMGTVLTALAVAAALSRTGLQRAIRRTLPYVNRASGALLAVAGAYVTYYWGFSLFAGDGSSSSLIGRGDRLSGTVMSWFGGNSGQAVTSGLLAGLVLLVAWIVWRQLLRPRARDERPSPTRTATKPVTERSSR